MGALELVRCADGSLTLRRPDGVTYHSLSGAAAESQHVFVAASGLAARLAQGPVAVLEVGYGTGLNFLLFAQLAQALGGQLHYLAYEPERPPVEVCQQVLAGVAAPDALRAQALAGQGQVEGCSLEVRTQPWPQPAEQGWAQVVVYDAFAPSAAPALWTEAALRPALAALVPGGCLVTFSVTGAVRRMAQQWGYHTERLPGYPPKREMLRISRTA